MPRPLPSTLRRARRAVCAGLLALIGVPPAGAADTAARDEAIQAQRRQALVAELRRQGQTHAREDGLRPFDDRVLAAIGRVPRHRLVPSGVRRLAYANQPLPIGHEQTISQPYIVALMTDLLRPEPGHRVLEVGTGSGYQAAVLAELVERVYTIEIVEPLARRAARDLRELGYENIEVRAGDGYLGWPEQAPFDGIIVTAAAPEIPPPLIEQLKPGGRLVMPVGPVGAIQSLILVEKRPDGRLRERRIIPVRFVPLTGER